MGWHYFWSLPQLGLECKGKLTEMGMAGAEAPAPWSECSRWGVPGTFSVLTEGQDLGCSEASRWEGFRVWSPETSSFPRDIPVKPREQITKHLLTILCLPYRVEQNLPCVCVCVCELLKQRNKNSGRMAGVILLRGILVWKFNKSKSYIMDYVT